MSEKIENVSKPINALVEVLEQTAREMVINAPGIVTGRWVKSLNALHDDKDSLVEQIRRQCKNLSRYAEDKELERVSLENDLRALNEQASADLQEANLKIKLLEADLKFYKERFIP